MQLIVKLKFLLLCILISKVALKFQLKAKKITEKSDLNEISLKERRLRKTSSSVTAEKRMKIKTQAKSLIKNSSKEKGQNGDYPSLAAFGDTGQVDQWFYENIARKIVEIKDKSVKGSPPTMDIKLKLQQRTDKVSFNNFENLIEYANGIIQENSIDEVIILGDSIYTDNKKGKIQSKAPNGKFYEVKKDDITKKGKSNLSKDILPFEYYPKQFIDQIDNSSLNTIFGNRLRTANEVLAQDLNKIKFLKKDKGKKRILPGNHSTDVDDLIERYTSNLHIHNDPNKKRDGNIETPKHSKVRVEGKVCYLDINAGDVQLYSVYYNEKQNNVDKTEDLKTVFTEIKDKDKQYEDAITKGPFSDMSYGRNKVDTLIGALKIYEAILTLKHCNKPDRWRVIRTHVAPFNSEVDYGVYFGIKKKIKCKIIDSTEGYKDFNLFDIEAINTNIDENILKKEKGNGRMYDCQYDADVSSKLSSISLMQAIDSAQPHFWLGSHLHASQLIIAPYIGYAERGTYFKKSRDLEFDEALSGPLCIDRFDDLLKDTFTLPASKDEYYQSVKDTVKQCTPFTKEININEKNPGFHLIFVIGNSGRFLDPLKSGECSLSEILWQRASIPGNKFIDNLLNEKDKDSLPNIYESTKVDDLLEANNYKFMKPITDINENTNYGFVTVNYDKNNAIIKLYENNSNVVATVTIKKITGVTNNFKNFITSKPKDTFTLIKYKDYCPTKKPN